MLKRLLVFVALSTAVSLPTIAQTIRVGPDAAYPKSAQASIEQLKAAASASNISLTPAKNQAPYESIAVISLEVTNLTDKTMSGIKVYGQSIDIFNKPLDYYALQTDKDLGPGGSVTLEGRYDFRSTLKANLDKVRLYAQPIHIIFEDGGSLKDPRFQ